MAEIKSADDSDLRLSDFESSDNPIVARIAARIRSDVSEAQQPVRANHSSHSSSPGGKGHTSYVSGRFEDV